MMQLYNTLTRKIEEFVPQKKDFVTIYTCGPTVYDYPHIGNWFTFLRYDLLVRTLAASSLKTKWVMNITDVGHLVSDADEGEDKLEKGAKRENKTAWDIAAFYTADFMNGLELLNFAKPDYLPMATKHIEEQIELIKTLEQKGFTYKIDDGIYFDTDKFPSYADFAQLHLDDLKAGARVATNSQKRNPADFALWKFSPKDSQRDMEWDSPWGIGFPGWHLECSAMSMKYLGATLDIHAGGIDHIPVHHTNEIAQSEAANGQKLSNYWLHTNHILISDEKISKSLGNGITLQELEQRHIEPLALRLLAFESHYRTQASFSWDNLTAAQNRLMTYRAFADLRYQTKALGTTNQTILFKEAQKSILAAAQNDLDTPQVLKQLSVLETTVANTLIDSAAKNEFQSFLVFVDNLLGLNLLTSEDITAKQKQIIADRQLARDSQDWEAADKLRKELSEAGIEIRDTPHGQIWSRI